jgi:CDP-glycerol glycerophosphotransferase
VPQPRPGFRNRFRGNSGQAAAGIDYYERALVTLRPDPRLVIFESMMGRQFSDSPRAIYEEMVRQRVDATLVWSSRKGILGLPTGVATLVRRSPQWYDALASAALWIDNQGFPPELRRPEGTRYLQTWHGTPLKLMGWNQPSQAGTTDAQSRRLQDSVDRWDAVTAPSEYFVDTVVSAFRSHAEVLRVGTPRNDHLLRRMTAPERSRRLLALGGADDLKTVLYAPTRTGRSGPPPALDPVTQAIARTGAQVLCRAHYGDSQTQGPASSGRVHDVTKVADMAQLLALADVLVTDYSSSMFDFSLTERPIILFQPDQDAYLSARGTYFDIREFPPGPIATTGEQLADLLSSVASWRGNWDARRGQYQDRFGQYETGHASERVVQEYITPWLKRTS